MAFFSDGIAHTALAGVAIALLVGQQPLVWAVGVGVLFSVAIYFLEKKTNIATDSLIGILFTSSLALGVVLMNFKKGYQPDLLSFLFGNILTIRSEELWFIIPMAAVILVFVLFNYQKISVHLSQRRTGEAVGNTYGNLSAAAVCAFGGCEHFGDQDVRHHFSQRPSDHSGLVQQTLCPLGKIAFGAEHYLC